MSNYLQKSLIFLMLFTSPYTNFSVKAMFGEGKDQELSSPPLKLTIERQKKAYYPLDFKQGIKDEDIDKLIKEMNDLSCERCIVLENVRKVYEVPCNQFPCVIDPFSNFFLSDSSGGYRLRLMSRNPSSRDLSQIRQGELGLFCEGTSYEDNQLYCKVHDKEKIHVAKSNDPAAGLYPGIVDSILNNLEYSQTKSGIRISDAYTEALFQHTLLRGYTPSANTCKYSISPEDLTKYYYSDGHKLLRAIVKGGVKKIYFGAYPDYFKHIDIEPDNPGLCKFGIDDAIEDRTHLRFFDKFMESIKNNLVKEFHLDGREHLDGQEWFFFSDFQNTIPAQKEIQINVEVIDCLKLNRERKKQEILNQYEKKRREKERYFEVEEDKFQKEIQRAEQESYKEFQDRDYIWKYADGEVYDSVQKAYGRK